ncbi:MAG TPA: GNAT family N-acetyltransferase [Terracidiphilus sp.]|jgi:GNAT superfamily N-acetyltransferase
MSATTAGKLQLRIDELSINDPAPLLAEARDLLLEYGRFVISQPAAARFCFGTLENEAARLPLSYIEQGGGSLIARVGDSLAGFVAWRTVPVKVAADAWELKRLWVRPLGRGLGLGRALTQAVLDRAVHAGRKAVYLDTVPAAMPSAHRLYLDMGFRPCGPYNDNPVDDLAYLVKYL